MMAGLTYPLSFDLRFKAVKCDSEYQGPSGTTCLSNEIAAMINQKALEINVLT